MRKRTVKPIRVPHGGVNAQTALKLPKGIHVHESARCTSATRHEHGRIIRENTHQTNVNAAEPMLAQVRTDVAMKRRFTSLSFESVKFTTSSMTGEESREPDPKQFEYRTPRVLARLDKRERERSLRMQSAPSWPSPPPVPR